MSDEEVMQRVRAGETELFEIIMRRYNQRVYRVVRAILEDDSEAEDVLEDAYVRVYQHLDQFAGRAKFSTWLTKIAVHEAWARMRRRRRFVEIDALPESKECAESFIYQGLGPKRQVFARELHALLQAAVEALPERQRSVFILREIEELSTEETAQSLDISQGAVKVRLHRARALLREHLRAYTGATTVATLISQMSYRSG
jgi:RNA polymerase sigma-70 factor (ECF subfamily)